MMSDTFPGFVLLISACAIFYVFVICGLGNVEFSDRSGILDRQANIFKKSESPLKEPISTLALQQERKSETSHQTKLILLWTRFPGKKHSYLMPEFLLNRSLFEGIIPCAKDASPCLLTDDRRFLPNSSAVVLEMDTTFLNLSDLPRERSPSQRFIFFSLEPATVRETIEPLKSLKSGYFNWTMSYRLDSDFFSDMYLKNYKPKIFEKYADLSSDIDKRLNRAIGFISHCPVWSGRDKYITELQNYFPLDMYGQCYNLTCKIWTTDCDEKVTNYKFYLAFENSICKDYITEKVLRAYNYGAVPIVMGGGNYEALFPLRSFIRISDFRGPKELADYLNYLSSNRKAYEKYLTWKLEKNHAVVPDGLRNNQVGLCQVCKRLHDHEREPSTVKNVYKWWVDKARCKTFGQQRKTRIKHRQLQFAVS